MIISARSYDHRRYAQSLSQVIIENRLQGKTVVKKRIDSAHRAISSLLFCMNLMSKTTIIVTHIYPFFL
jgi:hypothetical protein